jgi:hypothetical protein
MKQRHPSPTAQRGRCKSGEHLWQAGLARGQLLCLGCGLLACCPLCQPVLPTPNLVLVHCARHRFGHQAGTPSSVGPEPSREVQP